MSRAPVSLPIPSQPAPPPEQTLARQRSSRPGGGRLLAWLIVAALAAGGYAAWRARAGRAAKPVPVAVRTARIAGGVVVDSLRLTGVTAAERAAVLVAPQLYGSRSSGGRGGDYQLTLQELAAGGSRIGQGDLVASFDPLHMQLRLDDHRTNVTMHEAYMQVLTAAYEVRRKAQEQRVLNALGSVEKAALNLKTAPVRSAIQTERFRLQLEEAQARHKEYVDQWKFFDDSERSGIRRLELDIQEQKVALARAQRNLERMTVRAPISGLLVLQSIHRGGEMAEIQKGDQIHPGHQFAQVVDQDSMVVQADVNQVDAERLRFGQRARVYFDAFPDLVLPARVVSIGVFANANGFRRSFVKGIPVRLKLERLDARVIPNFTVGADVVLEQEEAAALAPRECVFEDRAGGAAYVWVRSDSGWRKREVELGLRSHVAVAVRKGLKPGEVVAAERPSTQ